MLLLETATDREAVVGVFDERLPGPENRMRLCAEGFETLGVQTLKRCMASESEWAAIDEIGYLECFCEAYQKAIRQLMASKRLMAVVRKQELPFLKELCASPDVFCVDLDAPYGQMGCVIMASGMGKRFGSNKLMADFAAEPLFLRAVRATEGIFARRVVVTRHTDVADVCRDCGAEVILHDLPFRSDTVRIGLKAMDNMDGCLFCPADQPLLRQETAASLALSAANDPSFIYRPACQGEAGSPVLFPKWAFDELKNLPEGKGGGYVIRQHPQQVRLVPIDNAWELADADDPETLEKLRGML